MRHKTLKKLFFSILFLFLPLIVFAQSNRTQSVALVPFWGPDDYFIQEFGEELYTGVNNIQGYRSVVIDMTNLPDDVPEGGFPPYICPSPSLIKTNPIAITGELTADPDDDEFWHLRLYLWEMSETRLVFSDEVTAYDREEMAAGLPGMLDWLFSWLTRIKGRGSGDGDDIWGDGSNTGGKSVFITTSMPLQWIYIGARFGWSPLNIYGPAGGKKSDAIDSSFYNSINGAISGSIAFFPESVPFFSRFSFQVEAIFNYDTAPIKITTIIPTALLKAQVYRQGNILFSLFGGAYSPFPLDGKKTIEYSSFPIGLTAGANFGGKLDKIPGIFFIDLRFSMDLFDTKVTAPGIPLTGFKFRRTSMTISIGYEYGLITKK